MQDYKEIANIIADDFGANATYVEDLMRQFQHNPHSVGDEWSAYFTNLLGANGAVKSEVQSVAAAPAAKTVSNGAAKSEGQPLPAAPVAELAGERLQLRGAALKIVENMETSLSVPTATSLRQIQIKLLDENRRWINRHL
ncbi:MAG TPA: hypothetical protein VGB07_19350, partial [Blastocatellia bacterium]